MMTTIGYMRLTRLLKCMRCRVQIRPQRYRRDSDRGRPAVDLLEFLRTQRKAAAVAGEGGAGQVVAISSIRLAASTSFGAAPSPPREPSPGARGHKKLSAPA